MRRTALLESLRDFLSRELDLTLEPADDSTGLIELGVDSVVASHLIEFIRDRWAPEVSVSILFEYSSLAALADHLQAVTGTALQAPDLVPDPVHQGATASSGSANDGDGAAAARPASTESVVEAGGSGRTRPAISSPSGRIAIVGLSGRFPGAATPAQFWTNLREGRCSIGGIPAERAAYWRCGMDGLEVGPACAYGAFLSDIDRFDPLFFAVSPREAPRMDPQQRLFLEESWKALEDAGLSPEGLSHVRCGVFAGVMSCDYQDLLTGLGQSRPEAYELMGTAASILPARIAYHLKLRGPALAIDTACSSSLVAIDLACRALQRGELDVALAGGVTLYLTQRRYRLMELAGMLSPTGACRPFDDHADGTVSGEGVGVVVLKRLEDALADRDAIHGVILATGVNQAAPAEGITVPTQRSQWELITEVHRAAGISPTTVHFVEAHGTGTRLGDPVEADALNRVFEEGGVPSGACRLGSVKANIGHAGAAAGMMGLIKVLLALKHQTIPPQIHYDQPNRHFARPNGPLRVATTAEPWPVNGSSPRRASVTALGFSGVNGHLVIEEAPPLEARRNSPPADVWLLLSARTPEGLAARVADLEGWLEGEPRRREVELVDLAFTLAVGRAPMEERLAFRARDLEGVRAALRAFQEGQGTDFATWASTGPVPLGVLCRGSVRGGLLPNGDRVAADRDRAGADWVGGRAVNWEPYFGPHHPRRLHLPPYSFEDARWWVGIGSDRGAENAPPEGAPMTSQSWSGPLPSPSDEWPREVQASASPEVVVTETPSAPSVEGRIKLRSLAGAAESLRTPAGTEPERGTQETPVESVRPLATGNPAHGGAAADVSQESVLPRVTSLLAAVLYLGDRKVDPNKRFADLGLDSILAVELAKKISQEFGINFSAAILYDHPTAHELAVHLGGILAGRVSVHQGAAARFFGGESTPRDPVPTPESAKVMPTPPMGSLPSEGPATIASRGLGPSGGGPFRWVLQRATGLQDLDIAAMALPEPGPGQVQIDVAAASVMLADLLCVRGLYPTMPPFPFTTGFEVSGVVARVGMGVTDLSVGDRVFGLTGALLGGHAHQVNVDARFVARVPQGLALIEATALPVSYLTAQHALIGVGRLAPGETLLIHSAASCTGLMAIQLARVLGVRVFATAGSDARVAWLRELGVEDAWNYEQPDAADRIGAGLPDGGVDAVLNVLTGTLRDRSLAWLRAGGRFLDLAVGGLKAAPPVNLAALVDGQGYFGIDCRRLSLRRPDWVRDQLLELSRRLERSDLHPLPLNRVFPLGEVRAGMEWVQGRGGLGRVVVVPGSVPLDVDPAGSAAAFAARVRALRPLASPSPTRTLPIQAVPATAGDSRFEPIAMVGRSGRFPGARDVEAFWENLAAGRQSLAELGRERFEGGAPEVGTASLDGRQANWRAGWLEGHDEFDAEFFGMARAEVEQTDPQHRLFLQEAWRALEDAGYAVSTAAGSRGGIYVGIVPSEYFARLATPEAHSLMGNLGSGLAGRLAYLLDWTGPCLAVDTACSSSFTAVHLACASLANGECDIALAGGVHVLAGPSLLRATERMGLISPSGQCRVFDAAADGWVMGEAVGAVVLKRLADAERDGDTIHAVIRGCGINQDGAKNGFTAPKAAAQRALQRRVYEVSGVSPATIGYVEVHGTGTILADELEVRALHETFGDDPRREGPCFLGTLKPNVGHPVAAAGVACLIKAVCALEHRQWPPLIGLAQLNANLPLATGPFQVGHELQDWPRPANSPRRAAINGLSATGTNCHLVLEEYERDGQSPGSGWSTAPSGPVLIVLSARDEDRLREVVARLLGHLERRPDLDLAEVAFTLQVGREALPERIAFVATSLEEVKSLLGVYLARRPDPRLLVGRAEGPSDAYSLLVSGAEGREFLEAVVRNGALGKLGRLWTAGIPIDWRLLYSGRHPRRIPLPTYPFRRDRFGPPPSPPPKDHSVRGSEVAALQARRSTGGHGDDPAQAPASQGDVTSSGRVLELLRSAVAEVLHCPVGTLADDRDLRSYGFDSLYVLRVIERFEAATGYRIPARRVFESRTLKVLADAINGDPAFQICEDRAASAETLVEGNGNGALSRHQDDGGGVSVEAEFGLTESQQALWAIQQSNPSCTAYHIPVVIGWQGRVDAEALRRTLERIVEAQPALRTSFHVGDQGPFQRVHALVAVALDFLEGEGSSESGLETEVASRARLPFDLELAPLFRCAVFRGPERDWVLLVFHHLIFDGQSLDLFLAALDGPDVSGTQAISTTAASARRGCEDQVRAEQAYLKGPDAERDRRYWIGQFKDRATLVPLDFGIGSNGSGIWDGAVRTTRLDGGLMERLRNAAAQEGLTLQVLALAAFGVSLARWSGRDEFLVGVPVDDRRIPDLQTVMGYFVNLLPIRMGIGLTGTLRATVRRTFDLFLDALEHRRLPFRQLARDLAATVPGRPPCEVQAAFYFQTWGGEAGRSRADRMSSVAHQAGEFPLVFEVVEGAVDWRLQVKRRPAEVPVEVAERLTGEFVRVLDELAEGGDRPVLANAGHHEAQARFEFPERSVHSLIAETAARRGDAVAVACGDDRLTYRELEARANRVAQYLARAGVGAGALVAVMLDRSVDLLVALLGVWKAGAAYVPLDPTHPEDRNRGILEDGGITWLMTESTCPFVAAGLGRIDLDREAVRIARESASPPPTGEVEARATAYVIYTSGSTGRPKGVRVSHRSLAHFLWCMADRPGCTENDRVLALTTVSFDIAALELFLPLVVGGQVEIVSSAEARSGRRLRDRIHRSGATLIQGTPATWRMLLAAELGPVPSARALCGGEAWDAELADRLLERFAEVWNLYGPTETTVWSSVQKVERGQPVHLGDPIGNTRFYVLDDDLRDVPRGEIGELYIGGDGLADGYLNRPDLTRERFIPHPQRPEEIIYRTGDLVRHV